MTFEDFLALHYHEVFGLVCEAATAGRKAGELSLWLTEAGRTLKRRLRTMHEELGRQAPPAALTKERKAAP